MTMNKRGPTLYPNRCPMCWDSPGVWVNGFCFQCYKGIEIDAAKSNQNVAEFANGLWENYEMIYNLEASAELSEKLRALKFDPSIKPKKGLRSFRILPLESK